MFVCSFASILLVFGKLVVWIMCMCLPKGWIFSLGARRLTWTVCLSSCWWCSVLETNSLLKIIEHVFKIVRLKFISWRVLVLLRLVCIWLILYLLDVATPCLVAWSHPVGGFYGTAKLWLIFNIYMVLLTSASGAFFKQFIKIKNHSIPIDKNLLFKALRVSGSAH